MTQTSAPNPNVSSSALRNELRNRRCSLSREQRNTFDLAICKHLKQLVTTHKVSSLACYWPFNGEPDLIPLCRRLMADGCQIALPVISENENGIMKFCVWREDMRLSKNKFGISEPPGDIGLPLSDIDMLIMPLVAYDRFGSRIGMGAGYYDRHLAFLRDSRKPFRVGVAYSLQQVDTIQKNNWDIPLHGVVNERGWFTFV